MADYFCTLPQLAHEIWRCGSGGAVVASLERDLSSPYRYRGATKYRLKFGLSWLYDCTLTLIDARGRVRALAYPDAVRVVGAAVSGAVSLTISVPDASGVSPINTPAREALLVARWAATAQSVNAGAAGQLREEWLGRPPSARRSSYLAAADAIDGALSFDYLRGA